MFGGNVLFLSAFSGSWQSIVAGRDHLARGG